MDPQVPCGSRHTSWRTRVCHPPVVRQLEAVLLSHAPRLIVIDNFFDAALCQGLMDLARERLVRSRVASGGLHCMLGGCAGCGGGGGRVHMAELPVLPDLTGVVMLRVRAGQTCCVSKLLW
jgi:hypothetical protein